MVEDVVRTLGFLCMGSRLRRIGERLQADTQQVIDEAGLRIQAGQYPFLAAIDRAGPLTIGELAQAVGITQPGATRTTGQLLELGYVYMQPAPDDQRRRLVSLTAKGQDLVDHSKKVIWPRIAAAVADLCGDLDGPILEQLAAIEDGLAVAPLARRSPVKEEG
ncbi:MarR family transcriptional regulator [Rhizobium leguminosarum]|uniref:MarR family winged helix-turn-helix transcriptional regulator n=1 Tax=Rhizobium leguminosarum TaxID=384 RepID=UPI0010321CCB|nr:MarR family transcriptional regulator [Rhizobium leguminosarum]QIO71362.1 MarR family transcriptional regulator [Rhizobium leguminosarum bv. trifolii]QIO78378.1 MarR family transcriptional regulator [Rhizobium leguminosarum bv. trifolii]TAU20828.1 MarR family transcriptional regulator [Rhizobium leguminosarum]TAU40830.1 MarR family transcriptional regulator [Rhizobium leguminosarum]TAU96343.1 MarR family transcriptional regulator [Rhizobium leguminosarum]